MHNDLLKKYVEILEDEEEAFWMYKHIYKAEPEKVHQTTVLGIMEEEYNHYSKVAAILFQPLESITGLLWKWRLRTSCATKRSR